MEKPRKVSFISQFKKIEKLESWCRCLQEDQELKTVHNRNNTKQAKGHYLDCSPLKCWKKKMRLGRAKQFKIICSNLPISLFLNLWLVYQKPLENLLGHFWILIEHTHFRFFRSSPHFLREWKFNASRGVFTCQKSYVAFNF